MNADKGRMGEEDNEAGAVISERRLLHIAGSPSSNAEENDIATLDMERDNEPKPCSAALNIDQATVNSSQVR